MKKITNVLIVGVGGQGTIMASDILSSAALAAGLDVKKSEIHGMSQRGGSVFSHVRFGEQVHSPVIPAGETDILVSLEEMETMRWFDAVHADTQVVVSATRILPAMVEEYPEGLEKELREKFKKCVVLDPQQLIAKIGNVKFINVALIGVISNYIDFPEAAWKSAIESLVPAGTADKNWQAFLTAKSLIN